MDNKIKQEHDIRDVEDDDFDSNNDGISLRRETVFVVDGQIQNLDIFDGFNVKVEELDNVNVKEEPDLESEAKKEGRSRYRGGAEGDKIPDEIVGALRDNIKLAMQKKKSKQGKESRNSKGRPNGNHNPDLDLYKVVVDESGKEVKVKIEETWEERRRRLTRERMRRQRLRMSEEQRQAVKKKNRIQQQKFRLKQRLEETVEEAEARRKAYREQKRKSQLRFKELSESLRDDDSSRFSKPTSDGEVNSETSLEQDKKVSKSKVCRRRYRIGNDLEFFKINDPNDDEDDKELRLLKYELYKKLSRQRLEELNELDGDPETEKRRQLEQPDMDIDFLKMSNKKRAPDDIEYLYLYESSEERRKKLERRRLNSKYRALRQMELEDLGIEVEFDIKTSRRCLNVG